MIWHWLTECLRPWHTSRQTYFNVALGTR